MASGLTGKLLHVDLTTRQTRVEEIPETVLRQHLGGGALACWLLLRDMPPGVDPLGPDNLLVFMTSVINGLSLSGTNRYTAAAKSPLTGGYGEAEAGGWWGPELRSAGYDGIAVRGRADAPVYLWIKDGQVEFRDARAYWGKLSGEVQEGLEQELGDKRIRVLQTGVSGERGVRFAAIVNQLKHFHGRSGLGAVMGAKRLKAIVVRGTKPPIPLDRDGARGALTWFREHYDRSKDRFHQTGTAGAVPVLEASGILPTRNFRDGSFERFRDISGQKMAETILVNRGTCYACMVACKREVAVPDLGVTPKYGGPEYESLASLGPNLEVDDIVAVCKSNEMCNYLGMDTISAGTTLAWAMECYEKGLITDADTGGVPLRFRDPDGVVSWLERLAYRQGFGDVLAEGSQRAAERVGRGSERFLTTVKGMEMAMHDPRHMPRMRQSYMLAPTGADHMGQQGPKNGLRNQVGLCHFLGYDDAQVLQILRATTGWDLTPEEMTTTAHRALTLARLFNLREGFSRADDRLPARFGEDLPKHSGVSREAQDQVVSDYYAELGWNAETGRPTAATIERLEIGEYVR